jgi:hypothetical protein
MGDWANRRVDSGAGCPATDIERGELRIEGEEKGEMINQRIRRAPRRRKGNMSSW